MENISNSVWGECLIALRERLGFDNPRRWADTLREHGVFTARGGLSVGTPQAAYKAVSRWESSTNRPTGRKLDAIAKTIEALGYYRQNGGPTRALIGREIARASSVEDWLQGFDLAKASEPPEHERVRLIGQIGDVWQYECHGPGKFWLTRDGEIQAGFCLRPGEVKSILTHEACLLASGPSCEGSNESRPNRQLQTALRSLWEREEKGDRQ